MSNERKEKGEMREWNYDKSGIENDTPFLACLDSSCVYKHITILTKRKDEKYENQFGDVYEECEITAWMPLPDMPEKKHYCQSINVLCESFLGGLLVSGKNIHGDFSFPVTFCPFCGEKAND